MKVFIAVLALVAIAAADVSHILKQNDKDAQIISQASEVGPEGYSGQFETTNGISGQESGALRQVGGDEPALQVQGRNSYTAPNGEIIDLQYTADEFGFHPVGSHLPTPPPAQPIPDYILKAIDYIASRTATSGTRQQF